jgi:hypothetical protein
MSIVEWWLIYLFSGICKVSSKLFFLDAWTIHWIGRMPLLKCYSNYNNMD